MPPACPSGGPNCPTSSSRPDRPAVRPAEGSPEQAGDEVSRTAGLHGTIDPRRCALLVVDMQVGFVEPGEPTAVASAAAVIPAINRVASALRRRGGTIAYTRHTIEDGSAQLRLPPWERTLIPDEVAARFARGAPSHALHPLLRPKAVDIVVDKYRYSAFGEPGATLDGKFRARGVETLAIAGTLTNVCCGSSARDAHSLDYRVLFLPDATATHDVAAQLATLETLGTFFAALIDADALVRLLDEGQAVGG